MYSDFSFQPRLSSGIIWTQLQFAMSLSELRLGVPDGM